MIIDLLIMVIIIIVYILGQNIKFINSWPGEVM